MYALSNSKLLDWHSFNSALGSSLCMPLLIALRQFHRLETVLNISCGGVPTDGKDCGN